MFVNDDNFTIFNDVVDVTGKQRMSAQRRRYVVHQHDVGRRVQRLSFIHDAFFNQQFFNQDQTTFGQVHLARFFIHREVAFALEGFGVFFFLTDQVRNNFIHAFIHSELSSAGPEMISGVRASSIRMESTSSTSA